MDKEKDRVWKKEARARIKFDYIYNELMTIKNGLLIVIGFVYTIIGVGIDLLASGGLIAMASIESIIMVKIVSSFSLISGILVLLYGVLKASKSLEKREKIWKKMGVN